MDPEQVSGKPMASTAPIHNSGADSTENVDRIREILFGSQMREYEQRFAQLEERLMRETAELKTDVRRRLDSLEACTRQEIEALSDRLKAERSERMETVSRLSREAGDATRALEARLTQSEEQASKGMRELRQLILERNRALSDELTECVNRLDILLNRRLEELRASSVQRAALASVLAEAALHIRGESLVAGVEDTLSAGANR